MTEAKPFDIPKRVAWETYKRVKANRRGAAGVDHESIVDFDCNRDKNLFRIWNRLVSGSYFPPPVKAVRIPRKSGGTRTLGVPTIVVRTAQSVVTGVLAPLLEPLIHADSYGYRPDRLAHQAIEVTQARCRQFD